MNRLYLILAIILGTTYYSHAQNVRYYRAISKVVNEVHRTSIEGGLFITFAGSSCFESNKHGVGIDHGAMKRNDSQSTDQHIVYYGNYWGKDTAFIFNSDKSSLNVVFDDGETYVYREATPPTGVTTCTPIRPKQNANSNQSVNYVPPILPTQQNYGTIGGSTNKKSEVTYYESIYVDVDCHHCLGSGRCQSCNGSGLINYSFGEGRLDCPNCRNGNCQYCNGSGKVKDRKTVERKM